MNQLPLIQLKITVQFKKSFLKLEYAGSLLRGQFGRMLKKVTCLTRNFQCQGCTLKNTCPAIQLFEAPSHNQPVCYILRDGNWGSKVIQPGEPWHFVHTLIGEAAITQTNLILHIWDKVFRSGFGQQKNLGTLIQVTDHLGTLVAQNQNDQLKIFNQPQRLRLTSAKSIPLTIEINTPLRLFFQQKQIKPHQFSSHHFFKALWHRLQAIKHAPYGFESILKLDEQIRQELFNTPLIIQKLQWQKWKRYSTRQKTPQDMSGLIGTLKITPTSDKITTLLWLGEQLHLGKNTSFGLGHYETTPNNSL